MFPLNMHNKENSSHPINMTHDKLNFNTVQYYKVNFCWTIEPEILPEKQEHHQNQLSLISTEK